MRILSLLLAVLLSTSAMAGVYTAPDDMLSPGQWLNFESRLMNDRDTQILINWQGHGGRVDVMFGFLDVIKAIEGRGKTVTFRITGPSMSAQASAICAATHVVWTDYGMLMFHKAILGTDPNSEPPAWLESQLEDLLGGCVQKGILTANEAYLSLRDKEVWIQQFNGRYISYIRRDSRLDRYTER